MAIRTQRDVMVGLDALERRGLKRIAADYRSDVSAPLLAALKAAKSPADLRRRMRTVLGTMDVNKLAQGLAETAIAADLIGRAAAKPRKKAKGR